MGNYRTTVILKTDIVDSTPRLARQTQAEMILQRKQHKQFISETAAQHHGTVFQEEGDAYLIEFPSVTNACLAAIEIHRNLRSLQAGKGENQRLAIRAMITAGDILHQDSDAMGLSMSLTARMDKITPPDEIYLSHAAWLVLNKAEVQTSFVDEFNFKGFEQAEKVYKVNQKHKSRVLTEQFIVFTDARGFTRFVKSNNIEVVENFLLDCDDLIKAVCEEHGGIIRQVSGDQYFLTFSEASQTINAIEILCQKWKRIVQVYRMGISIAVHKGNLNIVRSYVYGDDIHTTVNVAELDKAYHPKSDEISVSTTGKIRNKFMGTDREGRFVELGIEKLTSETHKLTAHEHGVYQFSVDTE